MTNDLESVLFLSINAHVMLISNLWTNQGLVNGAMDTVDDIKYKLERTSPSLSTELAPHAFPLCLAWAFTIQKSQGLTLPHLDFCFKIYKIPG
ncbi:22173_t:CDS:2, partial [Cetraspora pellucida]